MIPGPWEVPVIGTVSAVDVGSILFGVTGLVLALKMALGWLRRVVVRFVIRNAAWVAAGSLGIGAGTVVDVLTGGGLVDVVLGLL